MLAPVWPGGVSAPGCLQRAFEQAAPRWPVGARCLTSWLGDLRLVSGPLWTSVSSSMPALVTFLPQAPAITETTTVQDQTLPPWPPRPRNLLSRQGRDEVPGGKWRWRVTAAVRDSTRMSPDLPTHRWPDGGSHGQRELCRDVDWERPPWGRACAHRSAMGRPACGWASAASQTSF